VRPNSGADARRRGRRPWLRLAAAGLLLAGLLVVAARAHARLNEADVPGSPFTPGHPRMSNITAGRATRIYGRAAAEAAAVILVASGAYALTRLTD
jgi:hypothetical protein